MIARAQGWTDGRLAFSHFAIARLYVGSDRARAVVEFTRAAEIYRRLPGGAIHVAHIDMQLAAIAVANGQPEQALAFADRAHSCPRRAELCPAGHRAADQGGSAGAYGPRCRGKALRVDSQQWARYGFGRKRRCGLARAKLPRWGPAGRGGKPRPCQPRRRRGKRTAMIVIGGLVLGGLLGALSAKRRGGKPADIAQYAAGYGIAFGFAGDACDDRHRTSADLRARGMFLPFCTICGTKGVPVSLREHLTLLEALHHGLADTDVETFYHLARAALVKDERHLDRFDRAFAAAFRGLETLTAEDVLSALALPEDRLRKLAERHLTPEERAAVQALGRV